MRFTLIGGSQSSGSSLLRQILNRHAQIYCLNESHLFAKRELYEDWSNSCNRIAGLNSDGWHILTGLNKNSHPDPLVLDGICNFKNFQSYCDSALAEQLYTDKSWIMDKTPANVFTAGLFLNQFPNSKVILTIRNPYDTIASLINRGKHVLDACVLIKSAFYKLQQLKDRNDVHLVIYEKLVVNPEEEIRALCKFIEIEYERKMIQAGNPLQEKQTKIDSWQHDETEKISAEGIGRFSQLSTKQQQEIVAGFENIHWLEKNNAIYELMEDLRYKRLRSPTKSKLSWKFQLYRTLLFHSIKGKPYNLFNNPIQFD